MKGQVLYRTVVLERGVADDGTFEGRASAVGVRDSYGTEWAPGAWTAGGLSEDVEYPYLWMHDPFEPIGVFRATETPDGLFIKGKYDDTPEGQKARARAKTGSAAELSVGFIVRETHPEDPNVFTSTTLIETSQITRNFAAMPTAELSQVRSKTEEETPERDNRKARREAAKLALLPVNKLGK